MKALPRLLPPVVIFGGMIVSALTGAFPAVSFLVHPLAVLCLTIIGAFVVLRSLPREDARELAAWSMLWVGIGLFAGYCWTGAVSGGHVPRDAMIPVFLGLNAVWSAAWMKFLLALAGAALLSMAQKPRFGRIYIGITLVALGILALVINSSFGFRALEKVYPHRKVSSVTDPATGQMRKLPFSFELQEFYLVHPDPPEILRIASKPDPEGRTLREIAITEPVDISLPGTDAILRIEETRIPAVAELELKTKSKDFTNPAIVFCETKAKSETSRDFFRFGADGDLGGFPLDISGSNISHYFIHGKGDREDLFSSLYYFHFDEKPEYEALIGTNLPYLPQVEVFFPDLGKTYRFNVTAGSRTRVQGSHYSVMIKKAEYGDPAMSLQGSADVIVEGPRGEESLRVSEAEPVVFGHLYSGLRIRLIHPSISGEPSTFVRIITSPDCPNSISLVKAGHREKSGVLKVGESIDCGDTALLVRSIIPDAQVIEKLVAQDSPATALSCKLIRPHGDNRTLTLFSGSQQSLELVREELSLSVRPAVDAYLDYAVLAVSTGKVLAEYSVSDQGSYETACYTVSVLDCDRTQGSFLILAIVFEPVPYVLLIVLFLIGYFLTGTWATSYRQTAEHKE
ncbi:MAG: hypothetical protein WC712_00320 [Candidatus Brocadiia bacterium]